ncbi:unannotated protein [freshwater metagenome]|uniref:Unannotated protein n=1 Tax=freshwater metagenome TaxID=449393 RepID=A0A6J7BW38_9ZZZZ
MPCGDENDGPAVREPGSDVGEGARGLPAIALSWAHASGYPVDRIRVDWRGNQPSGGAVVLLGEVTSEGRDPPPGDPMCDRHIPNIRDGLIRRRPKIDRGEVSRRRVVP